MTTGAADGFIVMPPIMHGQFELSAGEVVPILRRRGLFRRDDAGSTLREHFGLGPVAKPAPLAQSALLRSRAASQLKH